jgi:hypothetical protein
VIDGEGRRTTISLDNLVYEEPADPALFVVKLDKKKGKSDNN